MRETDMITLTELERIAEKTGNIPRPLDFDACQIELTERERRIVNAINKVGRFALHNEFSRLNKKIMNHHHVTLSMSDGIEFRENGNAILPKESAFEDGVYIKA